MSESDTVKGKSHSAPILALLWAADEEVGIERLIIIFATFARSQAKLVMNVT